MLLVLLGGCRQKMVETPRYEAYERSTFFDDSLSARPLVEGTVPQGDPRVLTRYYEGTSPYYEEGVFLTPRATRYADMTNTIPLPVDRTLLERGQQQYNVYCSPCHGLTGYGDGMVVQRGLRPPPSYHSDRLREAPAGHLFNVVTHGYGAMYGYAARIPPADRWAIVAYVRALQLSQHAPMHLLPEADAEESPSLP